MKKLFFSALACVAFAGSAFASNEVVLNDNQKDAQKNDKTEELFGGCYFTVKGVNPDGSSYTKPAQWSSGSAEDCNARTKRHLESLAGQGIKVLEYTNTYKENGVVKG